MIQLISKGDLFNSQAQTWVNAVNCVGIMGNGIALEFKNRFPDMYRDYAGRCQRRQLRLGTPYLYKSASHPWILNFPTKDHWRDQSRVEHIVQGLESLAQSCESWGITSLAFPAIGCGLGQMEWSVIGPTLKKYLDPFKIPVELYMPRPLRRPERLSLEVERD